MPSPLKRSSSSTPSGGARRAVPGSASPSLRCTVPKALHRRTCSILERLERAEDPGSHREALADAVVALTDSSLDAFFLEPLKRAKAGFLVQQSASLGLAGARKVLGTVIHGIIVRMDGPQLLSVCGSIRDFMA